MENMSFEEFWDLYKKEEELDVWNMSLDAYKFHKDQAKKLYKKYCELPKRKVK
jgi:hypothetical protein